MKYVYKFITLILIFILIFTISKLVVQSNNTESENDTEVSKEITNDEEVVSAKTTEKEIVIEEEPQQESEEETIETSKEESKQETEKTTVNTNSYSEYEIYELAKIIMCEAEGESQTCKEYVGAVIMNRVNSSKFPNTIHDVIFDGIQFSPTFDGRWEKVEPNQACYDAAYKVLNSSEPLINALYFEACRGDSWHSRNLTMVAEVSNTRFYK